MDTPTGLLCVVKMRRRDDTVTFLLSSSRATAKTHKHTPCDQKHLIHNQASEPDNPHHESSKSLRVRFDLKIAKQVYTKRLF
jgi:hypothetical protein